jgi:hypothetical protein
MHRVPITAAIVTFLASVFYLTAPALAQTTGEGRVTFMAGRDAAFQFRGLSGGAGVLFGNRAGIEGDFGFLGDNSDEQTLMPTISVGGNVRLTPPARLVPFVAGGFARMGDSGYWYGGGGALVSLSRRTALRLEVRAAEPFALFGSCVPNERTSCDGDGRAVVFFNAGLSFGGPR